MEMENGSSVIESMEAAVKKQQHIAWKLNYYLTPSLLLTADFLAVCLAIASSLWLRDIIVSLLPLEKTALAFQDEYLYFILPALYVCFIAYTNLYSRRMRFYQWAELLFKLATYICVTVIFVAYLLGLAGPISRLFMVLFWLSSFLYLCMVRYIVKQALHRLGIWQRPVVIVGAGKTAELLARTFETDTGIGYQIVGFIEDCPDRPLLRRYPHLGTFHQAEEAIRRANVRDVILATPGLKRNALVELFYRIQPHVRNLTIVPDVFGVPIGNIKIETLFNERALLVNTRNNLNRRTNQILKRTFDLCVGSVLFLCILPILLVLALWVHCDSQGPVFHIARRIGRNNQPFYCYKFRTMYENADEILAEFLEKNSVYREEWEQYAKLRSVDPRVTSAGKWLRKFSLDELPQIVNVLRGDMSLVGPRPYLPREREKIGHYIAVICLTVPGITGLWQVSGRNEVTFDGRLRMDSWYVRNWSLWLDIVLLVKTVKVVLMRNGAY